MRTILSGAPSDNPSLLLLRAKGYDVRVNCYHYKRDDSVDCFYIASKGDLYFCGSTGAEALGLVALWEAYGENWKQEEPDVLTEVITDVDVDDEGHFTPVSPRKPE